MNESVARQGIAIAGKGFFGRLAAAQQRRLLEAFQEFSRPGGSVLEVGLVPSGQSAGGLAMLAGQPALTGSAAHKVRVTADGDKDATAAGRGFHFPFADDEFDWVCSSGVIEHMSGEKSRFDLVREMARVAGKGVFLATPNRSHPLNFSSTPRSKLLRSQDLYRIAAMLPDKPEYDVGHKRVFGLKAHFFLMISKKPTRENPNGAGFSR